MRCAVGLSGGPEGLVVIGALAAGDAAAEGEPPGEGEAAALAGDPEAAGLLATDELVAGGFVGEAGAAEVQPTSTSKSTARAPPWLQPHLPTGGDQSPAPHRHASRGR